MATVEVNTGDIEKWASKMEERGADFAADIVKKAKSRHEQHRKQGKIKFFKARRRKTGKRFAVRKGGPSAELTGSAFKARFSDVFKN